MKLEDQEELRVARQAATWLIRLRSEGRACHAPFTEWLLESSRHVKAYLIASAMSTRLRESDSLRQVDINTLITQANDRVVPLAVAHNDEPEALPMLNREGATRPYHNHRTTWGTAAATLLATAGAILLLGTPSSRGAETFATAVGEQREVKLQDGSLVLLNTNSQVRVRYSAGAREIDLLKGEALFTVEKDPQRPFRVSAGTAIVHALGTQFDVYRQKARTFIEVVDGDVSVLNESPSSTAIRSQPAFLTSGDRASISREGELSKDLRNVQLTQNWQKRRLVFYDETVAEAAAEFNRYNHTQIIIQDESVGKRSVYGTYNADHPQGLFAFLKGKYKGLAVDTVGDKYVIRSQAPGRP